MAHCCCQSCYVLIPFILSIFIVIRLICTYLLSTSCVFYTVESVRLGFYANT